MMSYLPHSYGVSKIFMALGDFVPQYYHAKFGGNWTTNKGKTGGGGGGNNVYILPK